jgi:hypothetical protein
MFSLRHLRAAAGYVSTFTGTLALSVSADGESHRTTTYVLWWGLTAVLVMTIIGLTVAIERRTEPLEAEELVRRRQEAIETAEAMDRPEAILNYLEAVAAQFRGFLRLRSHRAPGLRAWLQRRRLRREGMASQWIARNVHGPRRYQEETVHQYLRDLREPLGQPISRGATLGYLDEANTGLIHGPETVEDLWKAAKAVGDYTQQLRALVAKKRLPS